MRATDEMIGKVIDRRFEIRSLIGTGGMGTVYLAWQQSIGREVALKILHPHIERDVGATKRFLREARLASQLAHPNTVGMIDFGQSEDGKLFLAMELLRGKTLDKIRDAGPMSADRVTRIAVQLCDALAAAHRQQIIHRDLKLENILLLEDVSRGDFVKILDFGLAKSLGEGAADTTRQGTIMGTPHYMPPEAFAGIPPTASNDLYALGVVIGELVTGDRLWPARDPVEILTQKVSRVPALAGVPSGLRALVLRMIEAKPEHRPSSANEIAMELQRILGTADRPLVVTLHAGTKAPRPGTEPTAPLAVAQAQALSPAVVEQPLALVEDRAEPGSRPGPPLMLKADPDLPELQLEAEWSDKRRIKAAAAQEPGVQAQSRGPSKPFIALVLLAIAIAILVVVR